MGWNICEIKNASVFCKTDYAKGLLHTFRKYFSRWPLAKNVKKRLNFWWQRRLSVHVFDKFVLASTAHERTTLLTIVSYKHNVAAKHGSSKPLTTNGLWLLDLRIKFSYIGLHTQRIMGYVQIVYSHCSHFGITTRLSDRAKLLLT